MLQSGLLPKTVERIYRSTKDSIRFHHIGLSFSNHFTNLYCYYIYYVHKCYVFVLGEGIKVADLTRMQMTWKARQYFQIMFVGVSLFRMAEIVCHSLCLMFLILMNVPACPISTICLLSKSVN